MSHQERVNYIQRFKDAISTYRGFTTAEKSYILKNLSHWIDTNGNLETLIQKISEISLDIRPFLKEKRLITT